MKQLWNRHKILLVGGLVSIVLLVTFLSLQAIESKILTLDTQWLIVAGVPVLAALVAGGYIQKFKGLGIELESVLHSPVADLEVKISETIADMPGDEKESLGRLHRMNRSDAMKIERLVFILERKDYYAYNAIVEYMDVLQNLRYFEVKDHTGRFICLIPVSRFQVRANENNYRDSEYSRSELARFINALEDNTLKRDFGNDCISLTISPDEALLDALRFLRKHGVEVAAVVTTDSRFLGIIESRIIERKIANELLLKKKS